MRLFAVNIHPLIVLSFVDRDMFMRYHGGGIGHYKVRFHDDEHAERDPGTEDPIPDDDQPNDTVDEESGSDSDEESEDSELEDNEEDWVDEEDALGYSAP